MLACASKVKIKTHKRKKWMIDNYYGLGSAQLIQDKISTCSYNSLLLQPYTQCGFFLFFVVCVLSEDTIRQNEGASAV